MVGRTGGYGVGVVNYRTVGQYQFEQQIQGFTGVFERAQYITRFEGAKTEEPVLKRFGTSGALQTFAALFRLSKRNRNSLNPKSVIFASPIGELE